MPKLFFLSIVSNAKTFFPFYFLYFKYFFSFLLSQIQKLFFLSIVSNSKTFFPFYCLKCKNFFSFLLSQIQKLFFLSIVSIANTKCFISNIYFYCSTTVFVVLHPPASRNTFLHSSLQCLHHRYVRSISPPSAYLNRPQYTLRYLHSVLLQIL